MHRSHTFSYIFLLSFLGAVLLLLIGAPEKTRALILDGGVTVPETISSQSLVSIDSLIQQSGPATVGSAITAGGPDGAVLLGDLTNQVGVSPVADVLRQTSGTNLGTTLRGTGVSNSVYVIKETSGSTYGGLLQQTGPVETNRVLTQTSGTALGQVIKTAGLSPVVQTINTSNGALFGRTLAEVGSPALGGVIQENGGTKTGGALLSLGSNVQNISDIAGAGNEESFLSALSDGSLQKSVSSFGGGSFGKFVENVGSPTAARSIASAIANEGGSANESNILGGLGKIFGFSNNNASKKEEGSGDFCGGLGDSQKSGSSGGSGSAISGALGNLDGTGALQNSGAENIFGGESDLLSSADLGGGITDSIGDALDDVFGGESGLLSAADLGGAVDGLLGGGGNDFVPVKDFDVIKITKSIKDDTKAIAGDTKVIRSYLRDLCVKEFKLDPEVQHQWVQVAENLVRRTILFINTAYNNNPIFLSNPYVYFNKIDDSVIQTLIDEIELSTLPEEIKRRVKQQLLNNKVEYAWPRLTQQTIKDPDAAKKLSEDWEQAGGWNEWVKLFLDPQNNLQGILTIAQSELERRLQEARNIEEQKLAWGQGFFSYESCDDTEFTAGSVKLKTELRNCRVLTPGSLIKDQVSLILGTAIRQIENADEYDERISQGALTAWSNIVSTTGLRQTNIGGGGAVKPENAQIPGGTTRPPGLLPPPFQPKETTETVDYGYNIPR